MVRTDPLPGISSRTMLVPIDKDGVCTQEVCWGKNDMHLVKAATQNVKETARPKLRFAVGDQVVVRIRSSQGDGLEQWVDGKVAELWPELGGEAKWEVNGISGEFPSNAPYRVDVGDGKWVLYCPRDNFTLIRRAGLQPQKRCKGISKRLEVRRAKDGSKEKFDHQTERGKRMLEDIGDSDSDDS